MQAEHAVLLPYINIIMRTWIDLAQELMESDILVRTPSHEAYINVHQEISERLGFLVQEYKTGKPRKWNLVPASLLKRVWTDHQKLGFVRSERSLQKIASQFRDNVIELYLNTWVADHMDHSAKDDLLEYFDEDEIESFVDWAIETNTGWRISDYGIDPLVKFAALLEDAETPDETLMICDAMLNVVHQRSDLASWFVEGGSATLSELSNA